MNPTLAKSDLPKRIGMQLRVEAFNMFNRAQFGALQASLSMPPGSGTPRQFQLALRFSL